MGVFHAEIMYSHTGFINHCTNVSVFFCRFVEDLMRKNSALQSIQQILNNVSQKVHQEK